MKRGILRFLGFAFAVVVFDLGIRAQVAPRTPSTPLPATSSTRSPQPGAWALVDLSGVGKRLDFLNESERAEQVLDLALLGAILRDRPDATTAKKVISRWPVLRQEELESTQTFLAGPERHLSLDSSTLYGLVPMEGALDPAIGRMLDEHRMIYGSLPLSLAVFEYRKTDPSGVQADTKETPLLSARRPSVGDTPIWLRKAIVRSASWYYTEEAGYVSTRIATLSDLTKFLQSVDDVVFVQKQVGALVIGGRRWAKHAAGRLSLEDVAAIYQADRNLADVVQQNMRSGLTPTYKRLIDRIIRARLARNPDALDSAESFEELFKASQNELATEDSFQSYADDQIKAAFNDKVPQIGFSLDPRTNYGDVAAAVSSLVSGNRSSSLAALFSVSKFRDISVAAKTRSVSLERFVTEARNQNLAPIYEFRDAFDPDFSAPPTASSSRSVVLEMQRMLESQGSAPTGLDGLLGTKTRAAIRYFQNKHALPETSILDERTWRKLLQESPTIIDDLETIGVALQDIVRENGYQCARYDGALQGTEVGMTLFYTDLMMKLWSMDFQRSVPSIPGFIPETSFSISPLYWEQERRFSVARSWLAPKPEGFEVDNTTIRFSPIATRLLAASSDPLRPGKEVLPTYSVDRLHRWWNRNYRQVAEYEPQFHRLNEIQKWALIFDWMKMSRAAPIAGLDTVSVGRDLLFDRWMEAHTELRYRGRLPWLNSTVLGEKTECLKLLQSRPTPVFGYDKFWTISGGVSAGDPQAVKARIDDAVKRSTWLGERQAGVEYGKSASKVAETEIKFWDGKQVRIPKSPSATNATFIPRAGTKTGGNRLTLHGPTIRVEATVSKATESFDIHTEAGLFKTLSIHSEPDRIQIALNDGAVGELQNKLSEIGRSQPGIPVSDGSELIFLDGAKVWAKTRVAGLKQAEWSGDLQVPRRPPFGKAEVIDAGLLSRTDSDKLLLSNWNKFSWNESGKMLSGLSSAPPTDAVSAEVLGSWGSRTVSITPKEIYVSRPSSLARDRIDPAFDAIRSLDPATVKAIVTERERASLALISLDESAVIAINGRSTAEQLAAARDLVDRMPQGLKMILLRESEGAALLPEGTIQLPIQALKEDASKVAKLLDIIDEEPRLGRILKRPITRAELDAISDLDPVQGASYLEFNGVTTLKPGSALADLRVSDGTVASVMRVGSENMTVRITPQQRIAIINAIDQMESVYSRGNEIGAQRAVALTRPYYDYLQSVVASSKADRIIFKTEGYLDPAMVWTLHGGDPKVTFVWDQQDAKKSVENANNPALPDLSTMVVGLSEVASIDFDNLEKELTAIDRSLLAVSHDLSIKDIEDMIFDGKRDTIVWIADFEEVFDLETSLASHGVDDAPAKDILFLVCDCEPELIGSLTGSGLFRRVAWTHYSLTDRKGPAEALGIVTEFIDRVSTGVALINPTELQSMLQDAAAVDQLRSVAKTVGSNWSVDLKLVGEKLRERLQPVRKWFLGKVGLRKEPLDLEHPNRDFDSLIEAIGRDRIKAAKTGPAGLDVGRTLRSLPRFKVEYRPPSGLPTMPLTRKTLAG